MCICSKLLDGSASLKCLIIFLSFMDLSCGSLNLNIRNSLIGKQKQPVGHPLSLSPFLSQVIQSRRLKAMNLVLQHKQDRKIPQKKKNLEFERPVHPLDKISTLKMGFIYLHCVLLDIHIIFSEKVRNIYKAVNRDMSIVQLTRIQMTR